MLELRSIRTYIPKGHTEEAVYEKGFTPGVYFNDINDCLKNYDKVLAAIEEKERYNLYVTCNDVDPKETERKASWLKQELLMWDIDNVEEGDKNKHEKYVGALAQSIGVPKNALVATATGGGFHVVMRLKKPITQKDYFQEQTINYQICCINIDEKLAEIGLSGELDRQVFAPNRMFRLPGTISKKPGREPRPVKLLQGENIVPLDWDLQKATGLPDLTPKKDYMSEKELSYIKIDTQEVELGCSFLEYARKRPNEINEPTWYAVLGIVGRLEKGKAKAHEYSKGHHAYTPRKTDRKLEQALTSAGPRTCDNINSLWQNCNKCPNYKKVRSPIALKGKEFIATAHSGFHTISPKGNLIPQYDDLRKYYDKELPYLNTANIHYKFQETHWEEKDDIYIDNYAEEKFSPAPKNAMCSEFRGKVKRTNLEKPEWFSKNTERLINFKNEVLNIDTMETMEHSPNFGFKHTLPFDYDPKAECPDFKKMLENITCGDKSKQIVLMEYLGYALSNDEAKADKILVLTGEGQNGKSRFLNIWKQLGGSGTRALGVGEIMQPFYLQLLDGALFNIMEEVPSFQKKEFWELMKHLTTGGSITVARKFKDPYDFENRAKLIMTCNKLPQGADQNHGYFRRLLIVDFNAKFSDAGGNLDRNIDARVISNEMPGVANIAIKMYHRLKANKYEFSKSEAVSASLQRYKEALDSVHRWGDEYLELGETTREGTHMDAVAETSRGCAVIVQELRKDYAQWCLDNGEKPVNTKEFMRRLEVFICGLGDVSWRDLREPEKSREKSQGHRVTKFRAIINGARKSCISGVVYGSSSELDY